MMVKKILCAVLFTACGWLTTNAAEGSQQQQPLPEQTGKAKKDTTDIGGAELFDSTLLVDIPVPDMPEISKETFKNLFAEKAPADFYNLEDVHPMASDFVTTYINRFAKTLNDVRDNGTTYLEMMDRVLTSYDIPVELKYLAIIESYLKPAARSRAGAVGPWQFMAATGRNMGLVVNKRVDERKDFLKSTHAAAKYLTKLYGMFGDWLLVVAAYNCGEGNVLKAINRSGSRDFWTLQDYLPLESRNHVKKFIATHYYYEGAGGETTISRSADFAVDTPDFTAKKTKLTEEELTASIVQKVTGRYNATIIAEHLAIPVGEFYRYNPSFDKAISVEGTVEMRLPATKMFEFLNKKEKILEASIQHILKS